MKLFTKIKRFFFTDYGECALYNILGSRYYISYCDGSAKKHPDGQRRFCVGNFCKWEAGYYKTKGFYVRGMQNGNYPFFKLIGESAR